MRLIGKPFGEEGSGVARGGPLATRNSLHGGSILPFWFDVNIVTEHRRTVGGIETIVTNKDREYNRVVDRQILPDRVIPINYQKTNSANETISRISSNESVCIPDPTDTNKWLYVGDGAATLTLSSDSVPAYNLNVTLTSYTESYDIYIGYETASLAKHIIDTIDNRLSESSELNIYSTMNHATGVYIRNAESWVYDLPKVTAPFSVWNSRSLNRRAGVLITPCDIIFAAHYPLFAGDRVKFVDENNVVYTRTIVSTEIHPDYVPMQPDLGVAHLDSDLPSSVGFATILPSDWQDYLPTQAADNKTWIYPHQYPWPLPCFVGDQEKKATLNEWVGLNGFTSNATVMQQPNLNVLRSPFFESKIVGDSGSPAYLIVNDAPVLLTLLTWGGTGGGSDIHQYKDDIDQLLSDMGSIYSLTEADFTSFTNYS